MDGAKDFRRRLHNHAERSGREEQTARLVADFLTDHGLDVERGIGGHGVLTRIGGAGPARLMRADLDALPATNGARHACGHDGHMAMLAAALVKMADDGIERPVVGLFQPSEEDGSGMARCLQDPRLAKQEIKDAFGLHNIPGIPAGQVLVGPGALASTGVRLRFTGREAHAASPQEGLSPYLVMKGAADATARLPSGLDDPHALATLVHVRLGEESYGTSPGHGVVSATLRGNQESVQAMRQRWIDSVDAASGVRVEADEVDPFPETRNTDEANKEVEEAARRAGLDLARRDTPWAWSEDFGHAVAKWGGALMGLGAGEGQPPLHDDDYVFPDVLLEPGIRFWTVLGGLP